MVSPTEWRERGRFLDFEKHQIFVIEEGSSNEPLLCLHGFPTSSWDYRKIWKGLSQRFRVIAFDFLGFGFSSKKRAFPYSIPRQADLASAILDRLGITNGYHLVAHDYGTTVAQELLARDSSPSGPRKIRSLVMMNGGIIPEYHRARMLQKALASPLGPLLRFLVTERAFRKSFTEVFGSGSQPTTDELTAFWQIISLGNGHHLADKLLGYIKERKVYRDRWVGALRNPTIPVRFICGMQDPVSGRHMAEAYRRIATNADVVELSCGHYPLSELPSKTLGAIEAFACSIRTQPS